MNEIVATTAHCNDQSNGHSLWNTCFVPGAVAGRFFLDVYLNRAGRKTNKKLSVLQALWYSELEGMSTWS